MLALAIKWADCMRTGMIPRDDAGLAFQSTIWKTPSYPLPALNLTKEECKKILASAINIHYLLLGCAGITLELWSSILRNILA